MKIGEIYNHVNNDSELFRVLKYLPKVGSNGPWLAGGSVWKAIENRSIEYDLDFFFNSPMQFQIWTRMLKSIPYVHHIVNEKKSKYNTSYQFHICDGKYNKTITIQGVSFKYWKNTEDLLDGFDFTACQFAMDGRNLYVGDTSFEDLKARTIRFNKIHDACATKIHLDKYLQEGFKVSGDQQQRYDEMLKKAKKIKSDWLAAPYIPITTPFEDIMPFGGAILRAPDVDEYPQPETPATNVIAQAVANDFDVGYMTIGQTIDMNLRIIPEGIEIMPNDIQTLPQTMNEPVGQMFYLDVPTFPMDLVGIDGNG